MIYVRSIRDLQSCQTTGLSINISICIFCTVLANPNDANKAHVNKYIVMESFKLVHLVS